MVSEFVSTRICVRSGLICSLKAYHAQKAHNESLSQAAGYKQDAEHFKVLCDQYAEQKVKVEDEYFTKVRMRVALPTCCQMHVRSVRWWMLHM